MDQQKFFTSVALFFYRFFRFGDNDALYDINIFVHRLKYGGHYSC